jgi:hypothetical protein
MRQTLRPWSCSVIFSALLSGGVHSLHAQGAPAILVGEGSPCLDCLSLAPELVLKSEHILGQPIAVVRAPSGDLLVVDRAEPSRILVFSPDGSYRRAIGSPGAGPGEFVAITAVAVSLEGIHIFDVSNARLTILGSDYNVTSTEPFPAFVDNATTIPGGILLSARFGDPERVGLPLHLLRAEGSLGPPFGATVRFFRPDAPFLFQRAVAPAEGGAWVAYRTEYRIEKWLSGPTGFHLARTVVRDAPWFSPSAERPRIAPDRPPNPWLTIAGVESSPSLIMTVVGVPDPDFSRNLRLRDDGEWGPIYDADPCHELMDSIIEIIDVENGVVLHRRRFDECLLGLLDEGKAVGYRTDGNGEPELVIHRVVLAPAGSS